jgi:hypothetical protein
MGFFSAIANYFKNLLNYFFDTIPHFFFDDVPKFLWAFPDFIKEIFQANINLIRKIFTFIGAILSLIGGFFKVVFSFLDIF